MRTSSISWVLAIALIELAWANSLLAADWPQWMGPTRDGRYTETGLIDAFPKEGAKIIWRTPIAGGYSGPAVVDGRVYVTDFQKEAGEAFNDPSKRAELTGKERILCLDAKTGKELWKREDARTYKVSYPAGPRATPTVAAGKVYTLGAEGNLLCLDAKTGELLWSKDFPKEYKAVAPIWGFCGHPLIDGNKLICLVGGEGSVAVAFDKDSGKELWKALSAPDAGYCPPTLITAGGKRQLLIWDPKTLNSLDPETGKVYWSEELEPAYGMSITAPQHSGDFLYASGIGGVATLFKLTSDKPGASVQWQGEKKTAVYCANSTPLIDDGTIYGADCDNGALRGVELSSGKRLWESFAPTTGSRRAGHGTAFFVKNGERYFLFSETGDLIIAKLSPAGYEELSRAHIVEPTNEAFGRPVVWTHPAFADRCAFIRNDKEIVCVSLAK